MGRKRKSLVKKSPFKLRRRKLADDRVSLFLDRSVDGGHEYEFLQLIIITFREADGDRWESDFKNIICTFKWNSPK